MATKLRTIKSNKYARVRWTIKYERYEKVFPLDTKDDEVADHRLEEVKEKEHLIKKGVEFEFSWKTDTKYAKQIKYTLAEAADDYLAYLSRYGRKESTIQIRRQSYNSLIKCLGDKYYVSNLKISSIDRFIEANKGILSDNGINLKLDHIKSLINYLIYEKQMINKFRIKKIKVDPKQPSYLAQSDIKKIMALDWLDEHYKRVFRFYWETGCRLREPYTSYIKNSDWLVITKTKNGREKKIKLQPHHVQIIKEIYAKMEQSNANLRTFGNHYSIIFKKVVRSINREELHFHNLRDTFAVMKYLETRDIYYTRDCLAHSSVKVTEKYANFCSFDELADDFPIIAKGGSIYELVDGSSKSEKIRCADPRKDTFTIPPTGYA